jgi:hypothetical protein
MMSGFLPVLLHILLTFLIKYIKFDLRLVLAEGNMLIRDNDCSN